MNTNKILLSGLIGGAVAFLLGFLFYGLLLADFFESNAGSASGVMKDESDFIWWAMILGHLAWGLLFAVVFGRWANIKTYATGVSAGAVLGLLISLTYNLINYGSTNISTLTASVVDTLIMTLVSGVVGGVVGWFLGRNGAG